MSSINGKFLILTFIGLFFVLAGLGCKQSGEARDFPPVSLKYWGVFESPKDIKLLTEPYSQRHPKIKINFRTFREDEYKLKMLEAWAQGQGPDLFMIPSTKLREFLKFIQPMPAEMKAPVLIQQGTIKKEIIEQIQTYNGYTAKQLRDIFIDTVADDVLIDGKIYGLPYSIDSLSVYYNRAILKNNNIALPAKDWNELIAQASRISKVDADENLVQSTIALGSTNNISNALDIVSTLMMQVGITVGSASQPLFHLNKESLNPIQFYLSFAQKGLNNYSWSSDLPDALDAFTAGRLAYFIGYPYHANLIKRANPKLDFDIIPMFKPENTDTAPGYASYWITVVTKPPKEASTAAKNRAELAWQYILESTNARNVSPYLNNPKNPRLTALRELVEGQQNNPVIGPFAQNLLNVQSWYKGYDYDLAQKHFLEMIDAIRDAYQNNLKPETFLKAGGDLISQTYTKPRE